MADTIFSVYGLLQAILRAQVYVEKSMHMSLMMFSWNP